MNLSWKQFCNQEELTRQLFCILGYAHLENYNGLDLQPGSEFITAAKQWVKVWHFNIITLNYTNTVENIIVQEPKNLPIGNHAGVSSYLQGIHHVHGFTDRRMVLGVNEEARFVIKS